MMNLITGLIGVALIAVFLGTYAVKLGSIPLWIIIVAILAMVFFDYAQSVRKGRNQGED